MQEKNRSLWTAMPSMGKAKESFLPLVFDDTPPPGDAGPDTVQRRSFETDVTRMVLSGLVMRPIQELLVRRAVAGGDGEKGEEAVWRAVDVTWLAFAVLDVISELTEYHAGVTRADVIERVLPLAFKQLAVRQKSASDKEVTGVIGKIFDHLANRGNRYLPFAYEYYDDVRGTFLTCRFWLVKAVYTGEGHSTLYALTDEGYTAYFGLHETAALDAAAIGNLRIRMLIERGNVDDAIAVADQNRKQCIRKSHEIRRMRRAIVRNIRAVDFKQLKAVADDGVERSTRIQAESRRLHHMVRHKLTDLSQAPVSGDREHRRRAKLETLAKALERLNRRLLSLSGELQQLPEVYDAKSHRLFRRRASGVLPACEDMMHRVCGLAEAPAAGLGNCFIAGVDPPRCRPLFNPAAVMAACDRALERYAVAGDTVQPLQEIEDRPIERYAAELTAPVVKKGFAFLCSGVRPPSGVLLSELLTDAVAAADRETSLLPVAVAMALFHCITDEKTAHRWGMDIRKKAGADKITVTLADGRRYRGDELIIRKISEKSL